MSLTNSSHAYSIKYIHESIDEVESPALNQAEHSVTKSCSADAKGLTVTKS